MKGQTMKHRNMSATVDHVPAKWYVATKRGIVDEDVYSADTLAECMRLARVYDAHRRINHPCLAFRPVFAVKIDDKGNWGADNTQRHYV